MGDVPEEHLRPRGEADLHPRQRLQAAAGCLGEANDDRHVLIPPLDGGGLHPEERLLDLPGNLTQVQAERAGFREEGNLELLLPLGEIVVHVFDSWNAP